MEIDDLKIVDLRKLVLAAKQEFDMAVAFHEVWKPATYDSDLHSRLGKSYATQASSSRGPHSGARCCWR